MKAIKKKEIPISSAALKHRTKEKEKENTIGIQGKESSLLSRVVGMEVIWRTSWKWAGYAGFVYVHKDREVQLIKTI